MFQSTGEPQIEREIEREIKPTTCLHLLGRAPSRRCMRCGTMASLRSTAPRGGAGCAVGRCSMKFRKVKNAPF